MDMNYPPPNMRDLIYNQGTRQPLPVDRGLVSGGGNYWLPSPAGSSNATGPDNYGGSWGGNAGIVGAGNFTGAAGPPQSAAPGWFDRAGTNIGNALVGMGQPFGLAPQMDPAQRQQDIAMKLMQLGGAVSGGARQGQGPFEALGQGISGLQNQSSEQAMRAMQMQAMQGDQEDRKESKAQKDRWKQTVRSNPAWIPEPLRPFAEWMSPGEVFKSMATGEKPNSVQEYEYAQSQPGAKPMSFQEWQTMGKEGARRRTQIVDIGGVQVLKDLDTGETIKELGPSPTRQSSALPAELAGRVGLSENFLSQAPAIRKEIESGTVTGAIDGSKAQAGIGEAGSTYRKIQSGVDSLMRMMTGAGMNEAEAKQYAQRYLPAITDSSETVLDKFDQLTTELLHINETVRAGRGQQPQQGGQSAPQQADPYGIR